MDRRQNILIKYFLLILIFAPLLMTAQQRPEEGLWLNVNAPIDISSQWQIHNDASYRTLGLSSVPLQILLRTGIRYDFNKQHAIAGGVSVVNTRSNFNKDNNTFINEFRTWQEWNYTSIKKSSWELQIRCRIEQRFFGKNSTKTAFNAQRIRVRGNLSYSINNSWSLLLADEYLHQYAQDDFIFDQNRLIASAVFHFDNATQLQAGYMWLLWPQESSQHLINITFQKRILLYGKN